MQRLAYFLIGKGCGPLKRSESAPERSMMRVGSRIPLLLAAMIFAVGHVTSASADPLQADACAQKMRNFVRDLDYVMTLEQDTVYPLKSILAKYFPTEGCRVDEVIALAKHSRFFWDAYELAAHFGISFRNENFIASFGLRKDTGNIYYPSVRPRRIQL